MKAINPERSPTVKFYTLGCKANQYDTQSIRERFLRCGFRELEGQGSANVCLINTCTVTHRADAESLNIIRRAKRENPKAGIIVTGCLAELDSGRIKNIGRGIQIVKNRDKDGLLASVRRQKGISYFKGHTRAFLKVQDGCNNSCSYCKVSLVRGASRSRGLAQIIDEAQVLVKNGFKEIVLTGICLGAYGRDFSQKVALIDLINALENIEGLLRIRLSSIEASDISDELIAKMAQSKKLCKHLHIPLQSGDDEILKRMNRNYTFQGYQSIILKIKRMAPEAAITTDVLVGFPGEKECNFENTLKLVKETGPLKAHIFAYSPRTGTPAFAFKDAAGPAVIKERIQRLERVCQGSSLNFKNRFLNKKMSVLIEGQAGEDDGYWQGYTENYIKVLVKSKDSLKNKLITLQLEKICKNAVLARKTG